MDARRMFLVGLALALVPVAAGGAATPAAPATPMTAPAMSAPAMSARDHVGSAGLGDSLVPGYGNGGYDVRHYDIDVRYDPGSGLLRGSTTIVARLTQTLDRFNLDFALPARSVLVNGAEARFGRRTWAGHAPGWELVVTPAERLRAGTTMRVTVTYVARPAQIKTSGYSQWAETTTGIDVWNEPDAASEWWYPCNCHPSDKATYDVRVDAPARLQAISNGVRLSRHVNDGRATTRWRSTSPMASYLAFLAIGRYDVRTSKGPGGLPLLTAFEKVPGPAMRKARRQVGHLPEVLRFLERTWGPYPFPVGGAIVVETPYDTAFETQTRPTFTTQVFDRPGTPLWVVLHEVSHQWFGDSVTAERWRHIWLAEGFATYNEWLWSEHLGRASAERRFEKAYATYPPDDDLWARPVVHPDFAPSLPAYERGAMTLQALRNRVGTASFFAIVRGWLRVHRHGTATTHDFVEYAERVSGQDLTEFFRVWLESSGKPEPTVANGFLP